MPEARLHDRLADIPAGQWNALHDGRNPFVAHAFLAGLEHHGCLRAQWGWTPRHLTLWEGDQLIAAAPAYLKENSHGEFVFDHAWAHAYARYGMELQNGLGRFATSYFPKWLCAVPYSPVTGPRLLARDAVARRLLAECMATVCERDALSSAHVNFLPTGEETAFDDAWLSRIDVQYHWCNDAGWHDFAGFLSALDSKHRKNIRQERTRVAKAGVTFRIVEGNDASEDDLSAMHGFYLRTFAEYGNHPALTLAFLRHLKATMPQSLVIFFAERAGRPIAGALCLRGGETLYGRYWGASAVLPGLHFETCYYQGIDYCLRKGLTRFEPGAQGEHKLARGFMPTLVRSRHWIAHREFREALRTWCVHESASVRRHAATLAARSPFKAGHGDSPVPAAG